MRTVVIMYLALLSLLAVTVRTCADLRKELDRQKGNVSSLLGECQRYRTSDSLHAARVGDLTMKLKELREYRAEDARRIAGLGIRQKDLQGLVNAQTRTIAELKGTVRDSVVIRDRVVVDTLRQLDVCDEWFELHGVFGNDGKFTGQFATWDSLLVVHSVEYRRFLGFLWRTRKVKKRHTDVVSSNPHTIILGVESITIDR